MIENRKETGRKSDGLQPKRQDMAPRYLIGIDQSTQGTKAILLDDFGSGYSSFGMLQDYDFDILKMDISFVRNIGVNKKSESILRAIIDMAHQLEIRLVAEGAETEEQVAFLRANGCDYIQGYYYYKPMPENEFLQLLDEGK